MVASRSFPASTQVVPFGLAAGMAAIGVLLLFLIPATPVAATATPGPDAAGYKAYDNSGFSGTFTGRPQSEWTTGMEISGCGGCTVTGWSTAGDGYKLLTLPGSFGSFDYYKCSPACSAGTGTFTTIYVSQNGFAAFPRTSGGAPAASSFGPTGTLPNPSDLPNLIEAFYTELDPGASGQVYATTVSASTAAPAKSYTDAYVMEWKNYQVSSGGFCSPPAGLINMEIRLFRTSNALEVEYKDAVDPACDSGDSVGGGIQNEATSSSGGSIGLNYFYSGSTPYTLAGVPKTVQYRPASVYPTGVADSYTMDRAVTPTTFTATAYGAAGCPVTATRAVLCNDLGVGTVIPYVDTTTIASITPAGASVAANLDGSFTYTPPAGWCGIGGFTYKPKDQWGTTPTPTPVTITVINCNAPPVALADAYAATEDTPISVVATVPSGIGVSGPCGASAGVLCNDYDPDDCLLTPTPSPCGPNRPLTAFLVSSPTFGTLSATGLPAKPAAPVPTSSAGGDGHFTYTPAPNFCGADTFSYVAWDGPGTAAQVSAPATVTINVACTPDLPTAIDDTYTVPDGNTLVGSSCLATVKGVRCNDSDPDGSANVVGQLLGDPVVLVTPPVHLAVPSDFNLQANGQFTWTPKVGYTGPDCFTYKLRDDGFVPAQFSNVANACVTVLNVPPVAVDDSYTAAANVDFNTAMMGRPPVLANDDDLDDGDTIKVNSYTQPVQPNSWVTVNTVTGSFVYHPPPGFTGTDTFTYDLRSSDGSNSNFATVTINILPNNPPIPEFTPSTYTPDAGNPVTITDGSSDPDPGDHIIWWSWDFGDGFTGSTQSPLHTFANAGSYKVCLTVSDMWGATATTCKTIVANAPAPGTGPTGDASDGGGVGDLVAFAGEDQAVKERAHVVLHGAATGGPPTVWNWYQVSGPHVTLINATQPDALFTAPQLLGTAPEQLVFGLTVSDGSHDSLPDLTQVTVDLGNHAPIAKAGGSQQAHEATVLVLDGSASTDPDGDPLTFAWTVPAGSGIMLDNDAVAKPSFTVPNDSLGKTFIFTLTVSDGRASNVDSAQVLVTAKTFTGPGFKADVGLDGKVKVTPLISAAGYVWDFGDGSALVPSTGATDHLYKSSADYTIKLTAKTITGATRNFQQTVPVAVPAPPEAARPIAPAAGDSSGLGWFLAAGVVALLAALIVLVLLLRRRRDD